MGKSTFLIGGKSTVDSTISQSVEPQKPDHSAHDKLLREFNYPVDTTDAPDAGNSETVAGQIAAHGPEFVKTALLFMPMTGKLGKAATVATGLVYGLSEIDSREGPSLENLGRGAMGLAKGLGTRYAMAKIGAAESFNFAARGVTMGLAARAIDAGFSPGNYFDHAGKFSLSTAADRMEHVLLDNKALGMDYMVLGLAHIPPSFANRLSGASFADPLVKNMQMGACFGLASGTMTELDRQQKSRESFDGLKLAWSALSKGGLDALAAAPGGLYGRRLANTSAMRQTEASATQPTTERPPLSAIKNPLETRSALHDSPTGDLRPQINLRSLSIGRSLEPASLAGEVKQFVVTGGDFRQVVDQRRGSALLTVQEVEASTGRPVGNSQSLLLGHLDANTRLPIASLSPETRIASCNPQMLSDGLRAQHLFPGATGDVFLGVGKGNRITLATSVSLLPTEAPLKLALGEGPRWKSVAEMLKDPLVLADIQAKTLANELPFQPARLKRWAWEISDQPDLIPTGGVSQGKPYGYIVGGEQLSIQLQPLRSGHVHGPVLKFSTLDFKKGWGYREFPLGFKDAEVLDGPYRMTMPGGEYNHWYLQPKAIPLSSRDTELVHEFKSDVKAEGRYNFWDDKIAQFGRLLAPNGKVVIGPNNEPQVVLLDYNSIVKKGVPWLGPNERRLDRRYRLD